MSLYNVLRTGVSGMEAQSYKLATVADNIANANTVGYKRADAEFSSLILDAGPGSYSSGAVTANINYEISREGPLSYTLSKTDIAVQGEGFFVVEGDNGGRFLTRAGSFVIDGQSGNLVNTGGFALLGFPSVAGEEPVITLNGTAGLEPVNIDYMNMRATPSTSGTYRANLELDAEVATGDTPSANAVTSEHTVKSSIVAYNDLGGEVTLDVYWTKVQEYDPSVPQSAQWEVVVFDKSTADPSVTTDFPYTNPNPPIGGATPANPILAQATLTFDESTGLISNVNSTVPATAYSGPVNSIDPAQQAILEVQLPDSSAPLMLNITDTTQLAADFEPLEIAINGNAPATVQDVSISDDGRISAIYEDGTQVEFYRLPLANVPSPDQLDPRPGNVYGVTVQSGDLRIALPNDAGNGSLVIGAIEQSNVDLANELTGMIIAQRAYTANSKSFQTGNELLEVLVNLKR
ncbi:flagellar hook protein FlgE [Acuticoccus sp. M5D2P5]|uniref:flagellar hook protein FlgE n=1 Tax=Acuticoccus kalidii TaxID=2910977 RepID=UPI001F16052E|nr:flagellar hook protein FlgE [Acuticoccus kalidii]MCF3932484.1 flagellar hook protein FlgE [Acuticoccus kalidii]